MVIVLRVTPLLKQKLSWIEIILEHILACMLPVTGKKVVFLPIMIGLGIKDSQDNS